MNEFKVSIVIPVYNAEHFIEKAVESAVHLREVGEVILVEDGSPDNALDVCRMLERKHSKVKLFRHPNGENRGAGASRNLGIQNASCDFIAFLDADDYFLPKRFEATRQVFARHPDADGVYESVGLEFLTEAGKRNYSRKFGKGKELAYRIARHLEPEELFDYMLDNTAQKFCTDGICVKREVFDKVGLFDVDLQLGQDMVMWFRLALMTRLYPGNNQSHVAMQGVHDSNREPGMRRHNRFRYNERIYEYSKRFPMPKPTFRKLFKRYLMYHPARLVTGVSLINKLSFVLLGSVKVISNPSLLRRLI